MTIPNIRTLCLERRAAVEVRLLSSMFSDLDPSRVCKGKGVVTLRATLVHIDDEGCISQEPNVITTPSKSERMPQLFYNNAPHDEKILRGQ